MSWSYVLDHWVMLVCIVQSDGNSMYAQHLYSAATYASNASRAVSVGRPAQGLEDSIAVERNVHQSASLLNGSSPAVNAQLRVVWEKMAGLASEAGGSENIFCDLFGSGQGEHTFWLDSSTCDHVNFT